MEHNPKLGLKARIAHYKTYLTLIDNQLIFVDSVSEPGDEGQAGAPGGAGQLHAGPPHRPDDQEELHLRGLLRQALQDQRTQPETEDARAVGERCGSG